MIKNRLYKSNVENVTYLVTGEREHGLMRRVHCCCKDGEGCIKGLDCCNGKECDRDVWEVYKLVAEHDDAYLLRN